MKHRTLLSPALLLASALSPALAGPTGTAAPIAGATQLGNIHQLTFGGQNAEAYFSHDRTGTDFPVDAR